MGMNVRDWLVEVLNIPWVGVLVGVVLFLIGLPIAYMFYLMGKTTTSLSYAVYDNEVISPKTVEDSDLEVRYKGVVVSRVTNSMIGVWNSGTTTILGNSIVKADALRAILTSSGEILSTDARGLSRQVIDANVIHRVDQGAVEIGFDFLDAGDGFIINLVHSGELSAVDMAGTIRGLPQGVQRLKKHKSGLKATVTIILPIILAIVVGQGAFYLVAFAGNVPDWVRKSLGVVLCSVFVIGSAFSPEWMWRRRLRKIPDPVRAVVRLEALTSGGR